MYEKIKEEEKKATLNEALDDINKLRGNIKAFIFLALTDEPSKNTEGAVCGINAVSGEIKDLVTLFNNIDPEIKCAAVASSLGGILGKVLGGKGKSASE